MVEICAVSLQWVYAIRPYDKPSIDQLIEHLGNLMFHQNDGLLIHWNPSRPLCESVGEEQKEGAKPTFTQHHSTAASPAGTGRCSSVSFVQRPLRRTTASTVCARTSPFRLPSTSSNLVGTSLPLWSIDVIVKS
ncbi:hypothetical protein PIB30_076058 [Stylosanthes scabra]|uniref:Uncharacterized protein n=1 Tax=Stylosanthes scabra TaxID=79078 RepID=A0ABU6SQ97_9FABA|nr:hypothetical protein [Stylosanthes scabra]